ncbi:Zinc finger/binuclear cluster transcriptional regulator [Mycena chlorophos]|uniref:Zinc finger/binuclear cluster transcriptional regulator n=1 Tax=Mycena chlorophos TaxID=658473 RepID=A0A8H6WKC5_MYCCL|nr:Zinc finger/binuclear cluster transcriptional regulator [Mycena chlorophos]
MGGDNKCPVCQATFTRPQHVARHMRSHTGDRPYKCVHCGDQFARSDLLSRHINKCHGGASKTGGNGSNGKRKAASSRATTSKQACDQCVEGSLPCDGSNPCGKCMSRKTRCTFVKFHRQTAPVGPGHGTSLSASLPSMSTLSSFGHGLDTSSSARSFLYAQSPASAASFGFSPPSGAPRYPGPTAGSQDDTSQFAFQPPSQFSPYREGYEYDGYDYDGSSDHSGSVSAGSRPASSAGFSDYSGSYHLPSPIQPHHPDLDHHNPHSRQSTSDDPPAFSNTFGLMSLDDPNVLAGLATDGVPFFSAVVHDNDPAHVQAQPIPLDLPLLPAPPAMHFLPQPSNSTTLPGSGSGYGPVPPGSASSGSGSSHGHTHDLGLSLGLLQTPTPGSRDREAETRELKEFWKAYMRTPLTGPDALGMQTPNASATNGAGMLGAATPTPRRHVHRVSSLPSVKTPEREGEMAMYASLAMGLGVAQPQQQQHPPAPAGAQPQAQSRTLHDADDLRSYEAAVLARKAPELVLRRPTKKDKDRVSASPSIGAQSHSSLAGAFGAPEGEEEQADDELGGGEARPSFKRLPSQALEPVYNKRRREQHGPDAEPRDRVLGSPVNLREGPESVSRQRSRARGLSAPTSPTALGFVIN